METKDITKIRRDFKNWRVNKGRKINKNKKPVSYQQIADMANAQIGKPLLKQPTVASWGVRGHLPGGASSEALRSVPEFRDCPLLQYA